MIRTLNITKKLFKADFTWRLCAACFSISYVSMATRAIKRTQCVFTGSQTWKAIMNSIATFIDICKKTIFQSLI